MGILPNDIELLPPYDDRVFKVLLTAPDAKPTLLYIASAIVNRSVVDVTVRNAELPITDTEEKSEIFDVNCLIDDDTQVDIEMQASRMKEEKGDNHDILKARCIYNLCDLHSSQPSKGKAYDELWRTYQVMFCNYTVFENKESFINPYSVRHDIDGDLLFNSVQAIFVELTKLDKILKKPIEQMTAMERIAVFLRYAESPDYREVVNNVIESEEGLTVAAEVLTTISQDERERAIFRSRRIALADAESNRRIAERNMRKAVAEGEKMKAIAVAKVLLKKNMDIQDIVEVTGLTHKEVEVLRDADK